MKKLKIDKINYKYYNNNTCKLLLSIFIAEQETKAQLHFQQLAFINDNIIKKHLPYNKYK